MLVRIEAKTSGKSGPAAERSGDAEPGNLFTSRKWQGAIERTYGFAFHRSNSGQGADTFALIDDAMGNRAVSPAFGDYAERHPAPGLADRIRQVRHSFPQAGYTVKLAGKAEVVGATNQRRACLHEVDLADYEMERGFARNVRKSRRSGLSVRRRVDDAAIEQFYALYARQRIRKFASLPQPLALFENVAGAFFPQNGFLLEAHLDGHRAAFLFVLRHADAMYYKFGASDPDALASRPNNLLMAELLQIAKDEGAVRLDLGMTPLEGGLARFKRGMGAREVPLTTYGWPPLAGGDPDIAARRDLLREMTRAIVARDPSPREASDHADIFYRYFV